MTRRDPVLVRLAGLPPPEAAPPLSPSLRAAAHARLRARRVHPAWMLTVAVSVIAYLTWAVHFANSLF